MSNRAIYPRSAPSGPDADENTFAEAQPVAAYLARMSAELAGLAQSAHLDFLAYLLGMAKLEAELLSGRRQ